MGMDDEVLPDSQDEAELDALDLFGRESSPLSDQSPLTNASIPSSLRTSSSFVLPPPMPANRIATSTISQYTTDTVLLPEQTSVISAFTTSSSVKTSARPRPKPKPNYAGADPNPTGHGHSAQNSIESPSAGRSAENLSLPVSTFTADISERIKARHAKKDMKTDARVPSSVKKSAFALDAVIEISSDDNVPSAPSKLLPSPKLPCKQTSKPRPIASLSIDGSPHEPSLPRQDKPPATSRKRHRDPLSNNNSIAFPPSADTSNAENSTKSRNGQDPAMQPHKKKKRKVIDSSTDEPPVSEMASKKRPKEKRLKNCPANSKGKETEKDQFKSSEFILDSDDEMALGNHGSAYGGAIVVAATVPVATSIAPSTLMRSPLSSKIRDGSLRESLLSQDHESGSKQSMEARPKKTGKQKRKSKAGAQDEVSTEGRPPSKKARRNEVIPDSRISKEKPTATSPILSDTQVMTNPSDQRADQPHITNDGLKTKKTKWSRNVIEDDEEPGDAKENTDPLPTPQNIVTPARVTKASQKLDSEPKSYHAHPPKNRPLSAILQRVNGSSPRPRASPSISRSLLTRIVPLHPNRRTPPPPPPPRIIPKKTKKEIEREEKWEEELQETVEGWCELEEAERERMRRAKRDWELGLCEE